MHTLEKTRLAAKASTDALIMGAVGWQAGIVNPEITGVDSIFIYVFDYGAKWTWSCSVPREAFFPVLKTFGTIPNDDIVGYCGQMIAKSAPLHKLDLEKANELAIALSGYIGMTRCYQLTSEAKTANHFVVIRYGKTSTLRPFAMSGPARYLLPADVVEGAIKQVIALDLKKHPEWNSS